MSVTHHHSTDKIGLHDGYSINVFEFTIDSGPKAAVSINIPSGCIWIPADADTVAMLRAAANSLEDSLSALAEELAS